MSDDTRFGGIRPGPQHSAPSSGVENTTQAQPEQVAPDSQDGVQVAPDSQDGVQVGGLDHTENSDGTRDYPSQEPVKTQDDPTPQPEKVEAAPPAPTSQPAGQ